MRRDQKINKIAQLLWLNLNTFPISLILISTERENSLLCFFLRCELNSVLVPGHGISIVLENDKPPQLCDLEVVIRAWYGEGLKQTTVISPDPQGRSAKIAA